MNNSLNYDMLIANTGHALDGPVRLIVPTTPTDHTLLIASIMAAGVVLAAAVWFAFRWKASIARQLRDPAGAAFDSICDSLKLKKLDRGVIRSLAHGDHTPLSLLLSPVAFEACAARANAEGVASPAFQQAVVRIRQTLGFLPAQ